MYQNRYEYDCGCDDQECDDESMCECGGQDRCSPSQGCAGPVGPMGPRGPRGSQGPRGLQGPQGKEGLAGCRGPQGVTGPQGCPGIQGIAGPTGPQGFSGPRGVTGATGSQGPQGPMGNTGPAGESALLPQFASGGLFSYSAKQLESQASLPFDISNIQCGIRVSDDYESLMIRQPGTYVVEFGMLVANMPMEGDSVGLELNHELLIEESRMPVICGNTFVTGVCILLLNEEDELSLVADSEDCFELCCRNNTINAYLVIHQINA